MLPYSPSEHTNVNVMLHAKMTQKLIPLDKAPSPPHAVHSNLLPTCTVCVIPVYTAKTLEVHND